MFVASEVSSTRGKIVYKVLESYWEGGKAVLPPFCQERFKLDVRSILNKKGSRFC